jgi:hypothetical protein
MKNLKIKTIFTALLAVITLFSFQACTEEPTEPTNTKGAITIEFEHVWGLDKAPFYMNTPLLHPMSKDTITVNLLKYYISNVVLTKSDGSKHVVPESYYLISPEENTIEIKDIPSGDYTGIEYIIGVDSARNNSGIQSGALNPSNGMFWSWSTGYIFVRIEGTSPQSPTGMFLYHLGGFSEPFNSINKRNFLFDQENLSVTPTSKPTVHFTVNVAKIWHGPVKVADLNVIHNIGNNATSMAKNYSDGFLFDHIHK